MCTDILQPSPSAEYTLDILPPEITRISDSPACIEVFCASCYLLVALMGLHRTLSANDQIQLSSMNTERTLEAVDQGPLDQTHTFDDSDEIYWNLHVWQGKSGCPGPADKSWTCTRTTILSSSAVPWSVRVQNATVFSPNNKTKTFTYQLIISQQKKL